jgi:hypothetical protein
MAMSKFSKSSAALPPSVSEDPFPPFPSIPYVSKVKKMDKVDGPKMGKNESMKLDFLMDLDNPASSSK